MVYMTLTAHFLSFTSFLYVFEEKGQRCDDYKKYGGGDLSDGGRTVYSCIEFAMHLAYFLILGVSGKLGVEAVLLVLKAHYLVVCRIAGIYFSRSYTYISLIVSGHCMQLIDDGNVCLECHRRFRTVSAH